MEALGAMAKTKSSSSTALRKKTKLGKSKSKITQKVKGLPEACEEIFEYSRKKKAGFYLGFINNNL